MCVIQMMVLTMKKLLWHADAAVILFSTPAADGAGSNIRRSFDGTGTFGGIEHLLSHGYKELSIPAGSVRGEAFSGKPAPVVGHFVD